MGGSVSKSKTIHINQQRYRVTHQVGEGGFSFVYKVEDPANGRFLALKKTLCQTPEQIKSAQTEVDTFGKFRHDNILPAIDVEKRASEKVPGATEYLILLPLFDLTLQDALEARKLSEADYSQYFSERYILTAFLELCRGVAQFHHHNPPLAHNDIKPHNILVSDKRRLVLFDFGSVREARHMISSRRDALAIEEWSNTNCTPLYKAPELFQVPTNSTIDERTDVWALGCTLYAMAYMENPFEQDSAQGSINLAVTGGSVRFPPSSQNYSTEFQNIITWILNVDHQSRPFIDDVILRIEKFIPSLRSDQEADSTMIESANKAMAAQLRSSGRHILSPKSPKPSHSRSSSTAGTGHTRSNSSVGSKKGHSRNASEVLGFGGGDKKEKKEKSHSRGPSLSMKHGRSKSRQVDEDDDLDTLVANWKMQQLEEGEGTRDEPTLPRVIIDQPK